MPSTLAGTYVESDYVWAETSLRILLYELTGDSTQLSLARGLLKHQFSKNVANTPQGWIVLRDWPDIRPWSTHSTAPPGSVWDSLDADPTAPEDSTLGGFFTEMLHLANSYGLSSTLGIPSSLLTEQNVTFHQYLYLPDAEGLGLVSPMRATYPVLHSAESDPVAASDDPYVTSGFLEPETSSPEDWRANWQWMLAEATAPHNQSVGYFLRAWARSEAALAKTCKVSPIN
jgi:hypothetical protein